MSTYCRDPSQDITKPADDVIELQIPSLKQELEANGPGYYTFFCRKNQDGSNTCDAQPYTPGPRTFLKCDKDLPPPRFVINPYNPLQLNASGELLGNESEIRDCGRGWHGKMTARYLARRCQLMKTNTGGGTEVVSTAQTIYRIGYAQAQCERDLETTVACPNPATVPGSDPSRRLPVTRHVKMRLPVALDWSENKPGPAAWDTSRIATTDSRAEVLLTAGVAAPNKDIAVVPLITRAQLDSHTDEKSWSVALVDAMKAANPASIEEGPILTCNDSGNPCGVGAPNNSIEIWVDTAPLQNGYSGGDYELPELICSIGGTKCNPLLGEDQPSLCGGGGQCREQGSTRIWGSNFEEYLGRYIEAVKSPVPPDNSITRFDPASSLPLMNDPNVLCELASSAAPCLMIFSHFDESIDFSKAVTCAGLPHESYLSVREMMEDAVAMYRSHGNDLLIFSNHITLGNEGGEVVHNIKITDLEPGGLVSDTLFRWLTNPIPHPSPCSHVN